MKIAWRDIFREVAARFLLWRLCEDKSDTKRHKVVKGAIIGGIIAGDVGAVVGAIAASNSEKKK